ncbi:MAG: hypothetical protein ACJAZ9_001856 [Neolewinella sp.]|jgi:hypothetical protein
MRLLLQCFFLLTFTGTAFSQTSAQDSITTVPVPKPGDKLPSFNILTPEQSAAVTDQHGFSIVRAVGPANTFHWSDGTEMITFPSEFTEFYICQHDDKDGILVGYMIVGYDKLVGWPVDGLPNKTEFGLLRRIED